HSFKVLLEELSAEYRDLLLHTDIRWLSRGRILLRFLSLLSKIGKLNNLNRALQGKGKTVADMISALNAFKAQMNIFSAHLQKKK
ncbi:General transcription factor II-I repeat domain-containing protein 2A, partial [Caligus rogercresseyi]